MTPDYSTDRVALFHAESLGVMRSLAPNSVDTVLTDPPYSTGGMFRGDRMQSTVSKYVQSGEQHRFEDFSGDSRDQRSFTYWSTLWMTEALRATRPGGMLLVFTDWRQLPATSDAIQAAGWLWRGLVPWDKTEAVRPQLGRFRNQCEYVLWASKGALTVEGPVAPGMIRCRTLIGEKLHIAEKPVSIMFDLLALARGPVLDPFAGSGSVLPAALQRGLPYIGCEQDPAHWPNLVARAKSAEEAGAMFTQADMTLEGSGG
jgi:site-specific DNA-methyltransferase (adenine-specific)